MLRAKTTDEIAKEYEALIDSDPSEDDVHQFRHSKCLFGANAAKGHDLFRGFGVSKCGRSADGSNQVVA